MAKRRRTSTAVKCECGAIISRKADLPRHMKTHSPDKEKLMHICPFVDDGCQYRTLQKSNLMTHLNVHSGERPEKCHEEGCPFTTSDPGSLTRHRKRLHGYEPKGHSSESHASVTNRKAARQRRQYTPYTLSTSPSGSVSPLDPGSPSLPLPLANDRMEKGSKHTSAAYNTELITKPAQVDDSHIAPNTHMETPLDSGLLATSEIPSPEHSRLSKRGTLYATDATVQPVCDMTVSEEVFNNFLSKFNDWQPAPPSPPTSMVSYGVDNVPVSTPTTVPPYSVDDAAIPAPAALLPYHDQYIVDNAFIPSPIPPCEVQYPVDNASYKYYGYTTEAVSFHAQLSQPDSFATPDMGVYPQAVYHRDVDPGYFYPTYAGASGFAVQGLYVN